jgi:hypothetical protein
MVAVQIDLPEEAFSALRKSPAELAGELRLASAIHWYARGLISRNSLRKSPGRKERTSSSRLPARAWTPSEWTSARFNASWRMAETVARPPPHGTSPVW